MVDITVPIKFDDDPDPETETQGPVQSDEVTPFDKLMAVGLDQTPARTAKDHKTLLPDIDHDGYAKATATAKSLPGSSPDDVYEDPAPYRAAENKNAFDKAVDESPGTAIFFSKQKNVKVAGDAAEELGAVEALLKYGGRSIARGGIRLGQMYHQYGAEQAAEQAGDTNRSFMEILRDQNPYAAQNPFGIYGPFDFLLASERFATSRLYSPEEASKTAAYRLSRVSDLLKLSEEEYGVAQKEHQDEIMEAGKKGWLPPIEVAVRSPGKSLALGAEIAGEFAPQLLIAGATTYFAGPVAGSAMMGFQSGLVERYASPAEYFGKKGYDLSKPEDIQKIVSDPKIMFEAQQYGFSRAMIIGSLDAISGGIASQVYGGILRTLLVNAIAQPLLGGGGEALAQIKTEGHVDNWGEVVLETIGEFAMMPAEVAVMGGRAINDARQAQRAMRQADHIREAMEASRRTAIARRAPDIAAEHRADVFAENDIDKITIDADRFVTYMQDSADPDFASRLGLTEEGLNDALNLGAEIVIDRNGLAYLAGLEDFDSIVNHMRFDGSPMSAAEAEEFEQGFFREELERLESQIETLNLDERIEVETIAQQVEAQVKAAGRSDNEAQFIGLLLGERYATRGERAGMSPLEMFRRDNVRMVGPGQELPGFDMMDLAIDKMREGVSAEQFLRLRKTPMINALIERGGIDPTSRLAGELRARDITPDTMRRLFVEGGLGEADNLVQSEFDFLDAEAIGDTGYIDQNLLIDAIEADYRGTPYRSLSEQEQVAEYEGDITELQRIMDDAGLTAESTPQEIRAAVDEVIAGTRQFEQTDTTSEAFKRWFKDSKVVDENGEPLVVHHGTTGQIFDAFDMSRGEISRALGGDGAHFFTANKAHAAFFARQDDRNVMSVYLSMRNPMVISQADLEAAQVDFARDEMENRPEDFDGETLDDVVDFLDESPIDFVSDFVSGAKAAGNDGLIIRDFADLDQTSDVFLPFSPNQIKSVDNRGTFDPDDPRTFFQSTGLRAGTEDLSAYGIEPGGRYKVRDVAIALEARQRDKYGRVDRDDNSDAAADRLADWMADEVEFEYQNNPEESGVGWYSDKYQRALDNLSTFFPEFKRGQKFNPDNLPGLAILENRQNSRDFFTALLAITSDGQRVADNFRIAQEIYTEFRKTGKLATADSKGARRVASVVQNLENVQSLLNLLGPKEMHQRLLRELTVKEMNAELRAEGKEVIGGYTVDMIMPYSALVFGSKLGAFYANLMGATGYLTMDLWWTRSFNRYRGNMLPTISGLNNALDKNGDPVGLARFKQLYTEEKRATQTSVLPLVKSWQEITDDEALLLLGEFQAAAKAKGFKNTSAVEKAANTLHKAAFTALEEQPYNASDRKFMVQTVQQAQQKLKERNLNVTIADIQAILWYYEKRLYGELTGAKPADISYAEAVETVIRDSGRQDRQGVEPTLIEGPDGTVFETVEETETEVGRTFQQRAYHGTPHRFSKFDISKMGTGEGAQAFGWGLYFAERKQVAQYYRETLSGKADAGQYGFNWDGVILTPSEMAEEARAIWMDDGKEVYDLDDFRDIWNDAMNSGLMIPEDSTPADFVDRGIDVPSLKDSSIGNIAFNEYFDDLAATGSISDQEIARQKIISLRHPARAAMKTASAVFSLAQSYAQGYLAAHEIVEQFDIKPERPGRLFEVEIPEDDQFLNFETPIKEQSQLVVDAVSQIELDLANRNARRDGTELLTLDDLKKYEAYRFDRTGEEFYRELSQELGGDQAVSLALSAKGIAGNRFLDFEKTDKYNYVVYDDSLINVIRYEAPLNRGTIELRAHETVIRLGKDADASTFLHENGHLFLEQLKSDAREFGTEQLVEDWNTTRNWWASNSESIRREAIQYAKNRGDQESANVLDKMGQAAIRAYVRTGDLTGGVEYAGRGNATAPLQYLTEAMHEQYARGFEDYLRTGQAPSVQLQSAFNRFRGWLVSIYNAIRRRLGRDILDVQYSREVAQTVDRLLASDADIELVREQYNLKALYDSAEEAGMTPKQFERYQLQVARAVDQAKTRQLKKHLNEIEREQKEFWKSEGEKIAGGIRAELAQDPAYRALYTLTQKALADGTPLPEGFAIDRLDRKAVVTMLQSAESLKRLPKVKTKAVYTTQRNESGIHPDVAANMFGFRDGMEMLQAMAAARPFEEVVQARVDAQLKERYGDMRNDGSAVEEAIKSVHIDETAEVLTAELNALRDSSNKMKPAFVRQWAIEKLGGRKVSEMRPNEFLAAEKRHAKESGRLLRQGDRLGAQRAKFKQLMNFYMAKESIKARNEITAGRKYFSRFTARQKNYKTIDAEYIDQIKNILSNYQFGPRMSKDIKAWLDFAESAGLEDGAVFNIPQEIIDADGQTNYQDLTLDEFRTLRDSIKAIEAQGRLAKLAEVAGEKIFLADAIALIMDRLNNRRTTSRATGKVRGYPSTLKGRWAEWKDERSSTLADLDAALAKLEFLAFQIDGEKGGPFHKFIFQTFSDAESARNDMTLRVGKPIMDAMKNMPREMQRALGTKIHVPELDRHLSRAEIIMIALNTGNLSNRDKMIRGSRLDRFGAVALNEDILIKVLDNLTLEEWQFVQTVWDSFQEMYPDVEAVFRKENGRSPETIEAVPFEREFDGETHVFRGGYFPMMYDPDRSSRGADIKKINALEAMQATTTQVGVFSGMTKERTDAAFPVSLDITKIPVHLERTAHYITHYEAVRTTKKILSNKEIDDAIAQTMGTEYKTVMENWLGSVASNEGRSVGSDRLSKVFEFFRTNATIAIMGFSYTTMIAQTLGLSTSADALAQQPDGKYNALAGTKWMATGMFHYLKNPAQNIRMIKEMSGQMRHRIYNTDRDVSYAMRKFERSAAGRSMMKGKWKEFQRFSMMAIAGIQVLMVDYPTWMGAYNKALAEGKAPGDAVNYADSIVRTSQTAGGLKDLSPVQMSEALAPFMLFYSFFSVLYNIERQIVGDVVKGGKTFIKDVPQAAARVFMVLALSTIIENLYKDKWPDEDEDEDGIISGWDYAKWITLKTAYFGLSSIPLLRDVVGGVMSGFDYSMSPVDSLGDNVGKMIPAISKAIDDGEMTELGLKSIAGVIGFSVGAPVTSINRMIRTAFKMEEGEDVDWYDWLVGYRKPSTSAFKD